ncbi:hypothetical protein [Catellatospora sp. NPDC049609]|uniref:hypothetical protein n=1 Tax=Catellatospora sp. NPDC049609 TaxID=3155505 RepID=UPI003422441C
MTDTRPGPADTRPAEVAGAAPARDADDTRPACTGAVLRRLLRDVLPPHGRVLLAGPHAADVIALVARSGAHTTVLVGDAGQAREAAAAAYPGSVDLRTGAVGEPVDQPPFDVVLAVDGLDRVPGLDGPGLSWPHRLRLLAGYAAGMCRTEPDRVGVPVFVVGCGNAFSLVRLLDARPFGQRPADPPETSSPVTGDLAARPASPGALAAALAEAGIADGAVYAAFGPDGEPHTILDTATVLGPGGFAARAAVRGMEAAASGMPLLRPVAEAAESAVRAGLLAAVPARWLAVSGARARALYTRGGAELVVAADPEPDGWRVTGDVDVPPQGRAVPDPAVPPLRARAEATRPVRVETTSPPPAHAETAPPPAVRAEAVSPLYVSAGGVPARVPEGGTVERLLRGQAAAGDVTAVRVLAAEIGAWLRAYHAVRPDALVCLDDLVPAGPALVPGVLGWAWAEPVGSGEVLAAAWFRWHERLAAAGAPHPWPPWMSADDLVAVWLDAAGEPPGPEILAQGRRIAAALRAAEGVPATPADLRTALTVAASAREHTAELSEHIGALSRTLRLRDEQLQVRERHIREQRAQLRRIRGSRSFRLVRLLQQLWHPRELARAVARRLHLR